MKIKFIIFLILVASLSFSEAQETYLGLKTGYLNASLDGTFNGQNTNSLNSFTTGLAIVTKFERIPFGFSVEPGYARKGANIPEDTLNYRFHYVNLPVLLDFYPHQKIKLSAGIESGYLLKALNSNGDTKSNLSGTYNKRLEASMVLGASFSVTYFIDLGFRYVQGFTNISKNDAMIDAENLSNNSWRILAVWKIAN